MKTIKILMGLALTLIASFTFAGSSDLVNLFASHGADSLVTFAGSSILATVGLSLSSVRDELGSYTRDNNTEIRDMVYTKSQAQKYMRTVTKIKGEYPATHTVTDRLVQGFASVWNAKGLTTFKTNILKSYHQKVNFKFTPADVLSSWLGFLYDEKLSKEDMPISKYIMDKVLAPAVERDIEYLCGKGVYDANDLATFGKSMDGLVELLKDGVASSTKPMYKIPLATLTSSNILAQIERFEDNIPVEVSGMIDKIYMSATNAKMYRRAARAAYGTMQDFTKDTVHRTVDGDREIVGLVCLNGYDNVFATPDENFLKLIDAVDNPPAINDIQVADYDVKVFMEFHLGIGFYINQMVIASVNAGSGSGLTTDNDVYYSSGV